MSVRGVSLMAELYAGRVRWDLLRDFPEQSESERRAGDLVVGRCGAFLREFVDPEVVESTGRLPEGLLRECAERGYLALCLPVAQGGLGLSAYNAFRVVRAAAGWSPAVALALALHLGFGAAAYLPLLRDGELSDRIVRACAEGAVFADADTEPCGAANAHRATSAEPVAGGYVLSGEKIFVQNAEAARLLLVSATILDGGGTLAAPVGGPSEAPGDETSGVDGGETSRADGGETAGADGGETSGLAGGETAGAAGSETSRSAGGEAPTGLGGEGPSLFLVDGDAPGLTVTARHEFLGFRGADNGTLRFDRVFVPHSGLLFRPPPGAGPEQQIGRQPDGSTQPGSVPGPRSGDGEHGTSDGEHGTSDGQHGTSDGQHGTSDGQHGASDGEPGAAGAEREPSHSDHELTGAALRALASRGRLYPVAATAGALARQAVRCAREFVRDRRVDGRPLGTYEEVQRLLAGALADVFALDTVVDWCFLAEEGGTGAEPGVDAGAERIAAKNLTSLACWRVVDRALSLLATEGLETARSKTARGARPLPMERLFRDARGLRVAGGVDFLVGHRSARAQLAALYAGEPAGPVPYTAPVPLTGRNADHADWVDRRARAFGERCRTLVRAHPEPERLFERQRTLILLSRVADDLFAMAAVLARAARMTAAGHPAAGKLADVFCAEARHRVDDAFARLATATETPYAGLSAAWRTDEDGGGHGHGRGEADEDVAGGGDGTLGFPDREMFVEPFEMFVDPFDPFEPFEPFEREVEAL
ncbi:acyl-CoA dehydrogenase family protein [Streptomyces sp. NPDC004610]|uniref:acyl-CoA dehydrogenase family protein n=1 Tax=unclassified Streptomyces TaxID=2593676 RepID=UPI0033A506E6